MIRIAKKKKTRKRRNKTRILEKVVNTTDEDVRNNVIYVMNFLVVDSVMMPSSLNRRLTILKTIRWIDTL